MFRLVFLAFHGPSPARCGRTRGTHGTQHRGTQHAAPAPGTAHLHDAPPAMALALIVLAIGSVVAGYVGLPHALGGSNRFEQFLEPSFSGAGPSRRGGGGERTLEARR